MPEVGGRIVNTSVKLIPGGRFSKGEVMARIDSRDYRYALEAEKARLKQAELEVQLEMGRQNTAAREWEMHGDGRPVEEAQLALRRPHLALAQQNLESAKSAVARAQLNINRTSLVAPFNAIVVEERLEVGQVVGQGSQVVSLVGTDSFWVNVSIPVSSLELIDVPGINAKEGSPVTVKHVLSASRTVIRPGRILGLGGRLDAGTRTAQLLVEVDNPLEAPSAAADAPPLLPGAYVDLQIEGRLHYGVYELPRVALVDGTRVWVVDAEDKLLSREVELAWAGEQQMHVRGGLSDGERVVITPLSLPVSGMKVQVTQPELDASK